MPFKESLSPNQPTSLIRNDAWANIITGMGYKQYDKRMSTKMSTSLILDRQELTDIFRSEGLGTRIIKVPAKDMVRGWCTIDGDPDNLIVKKMRKIKTVKSFYEALLWSRTYGGSAILMYINDGKELKEPVNENNIQSIDGFDVYEKEDITWTTSDLYSDPNKAGYGEPEFYTLQNNTTGLPLTVHESRILIFDGEEVPNLERSQNMGWGDSVIQSVYSSLRGVCSGRGGIEFLLSEYVLNVMKIGNLQQMLDMPNGSQMIQQRMQILDMVKHIMNTLVVDEKETFERLEVGAASGLGDLWSLTIDVLCGISGIPRVKLIGDQSKGLGSEAAGNIRFYYDDIASSREFDIQPQIEKLTNYLILSKELNIPGLEDWSVNFSPLYQPTPKEMSEIRKNNAESDSKYIDKGLDPAQVFISRFGGNSYSMDLNLDPKYLKELEQSGEDLNQEVE